MIAATKHLRWIASAALLLATLAGLHEESSAYTATPAALTGRTNKNGGLGCGDANCHTNNTKDASVSITGPSTLRPGELGTYTVTATKASLGSGAKMGMAVAASDAGTPLSETASNLVLQGSEIIHSSAGGALPATSGSGSASYQFRYTMPAGAAVGSLHTLYAVAALVKIGIVGSWNHAANFSVTAAGTAPTITSAVPPSTGKVGTPYTHTYTATGNPAPTFSVSSGALPTGLVLNANTGAVTGTPTVAGTFNGTVRAANGVSPAATQNFSITIGSATAAPVFTSPAPPGTGTVGVAYSHTYAATGNPAPTFTVTAGALPAGLVLNASTGAVTGTPTAPGTFSGTVTATNGVGPAATQSFSITIVVATTSNYQGLWWADPPGSESGWGINFAHQGDIIFATWFTYDLNGKPWWLAVVATRVAPGVYTGDLFTTAGPPFNAVPFAPSPIETTVGTATFTFSDDDHAKFDYTVNVDTPTKSVITQTKNITRQAFGTVPRCVWGGQADLALATNFQDLWWNDPPFSESGWGINLTHQDDLIFVTWFTYDADGKPWWLAFLVSLTAPGVYSGEVFTTTGPPFNAVPFAPPAIETTVGTVTLTFADGNHATFAYTVNGITQTKQIVRQVFVEPGTACK